MDVRSRRTMPRMVVPPSHKTVSMLTCWNLSKMCRTKCRKVRCYRSKKESDRVLPVGLSVTYYSVISISHDNTHTHTHDISTSIDENHPGTYCFVSSWSNMKEREIAVLFVIYTCDDIVQILILTK